MLAALKTQNAGLEPRRRRPCAVPAAAVLAIVAGFWLVMNAPAQEPGGLSDDTNTVLLCHLNQTEGGIIKDSATVRKPRNGTVVGKPAWVPGKFGNALQFDGAQDAVDFGKIDSVFGQGPQTTLWEGTIEFWFSPLADINGKAPQGDIVDCNVSPRIGFNTAGQLQAGWMAQPWAGANYHELAGGPAVWKAGTWYNVKYCWDPKGHYLFVNDKLVASDKLATSMTLGSLKVSLGAYWNGTVWCEYWAGKLDELRISTINRYPEMTAQAAGPTPSKPVVAGALKRGDLGPYAYAFGPGWLPPAPGFTRVSSGTGYSQERGFGWVSGLYRHRKVDRVDWTSCALTQTSVGWFGTAEDYAPAKFRLDCPAGKYRVFAVGGGYEWTQTDLLFGGVKQAALRTFKVPFVIRSAMFEVETKTPQLELEIQSPLFRWTLCGLVIYPADDRARIEEKLARVQHEIDAGSPEWRASMKIEPLLEEPSDPAALPAPDDSSAQRGFMLSAVPIQDIAPPTVKPGKEQLLPDRTLRMEVARDERQTQRLRLWALQRLEDVRLDPDRGLRSADGKTLPPDSVEVFRLDYQWRARLNVTAGGAASFHPREFWLYPTKMERQGALPWGADGSGALNMVPVYVAPNRAQEFAVVVRVSRDTAPGDYTGTLRLRANAADTEVPLAVRVLPFALSDEGLPQYRFYGYIDPAIDSPSAPVQTAAIDYMRKELHFMKDWGANQWPTDYYHYVDRPDPEKSLDPRFLHFMKICEEEGMIGGKNFYVWWTPWISYFGIPLYDKPEACGDLDTNPKYQAAREKTQAELRMILREFKDRGWPEPLFGPMDEPQLVHGPVLKALHNVVHPTGAKLSTQTPSNETDLKWLDVIDVPLSYNNWLFLAQCQELRRRGIPNQFWRGIWGHDRTRNLSRAETGLLGLYCGVDAYQFAFWYVPTLNPESDLDNVGWPVEMTAGYLRDFGPISSLNTEVLRTARDDARYALAVRRLAQEAKKDPARKALADKTEADLDHMLNTLVESPKTVMGMERAYAIDWDGCRRQLKNWALALSGQAVPATDWAPVPPFSRYLNPTVKPAPPKSAPASMLDAEGAGWKLQFSDKFDRLELGKDWKILSGDWKIAQGALVAKSDGDAEIVVDKKFPGSQRLEYDAVSDHPGDLSGVLGTNGGGYKEGYFFGFGSDGNAVSKLLIAGGTEAVYDGVITPGKTHHLICQREGDLLTHVADGQVLMTHKDANPLLGDLHQMAGFYIWAEGRISNVKVFTKAE